MVNLFCFGWCMQEKRLRVNMRLKKLQEKVKEHQEKVGEKVCWCLAYNMKLLFTTYLKKKKKKKKWYCTLFISDVLEDSLRTCFGYILWW